MGYHTVRLSTKAQDIYTIITALGKYAYQRLPMGVSSSSDIFQMKMMQLMQGLEEFVRKYLNDLFIIGKGSFEDHLAQLEQVLERLKGANLKVNTKRSNFFPPRLIT